jgi:hypothetical protein
MGHNVQGAWRDLQSSTNFVITKLFTKEDPVYLHKILGLLALISFYYRYALLRVPGGGLGFGVANWTWFDAITIGLHLALSFSSIIFHVLRHRILTKPLIIYEEVQLIVCDRLYVCCHGHISPSSAFLLPSSHMAFFICRPVSGSVPSHGDSTDCTPWSSPCVARQCGSLPCLCALPY